MDIKNPLNPKLLIIYATLNPRAPPCTKIKTGINILIFNKPIL